jgi:hypothetical protein
VSATNEIIDQVDVLAIRETDRRGERGIARWVRSDRVDGVDLRGCVYRQAQVLAAWSAAGR